MLRITRTERADGAELRLEGKLVGPWVAALDQACAARAAPLRLDLRAMNFADADGIALLRRLAAAGVDLADCCALVEELMRGG
jgi:hypothetical protein